MMWCYVCQETVPMDELDNHVRLFHPDAWPITTTVEWSGT